MTPPNKERWLALSPLLDDLLDLDAADRALHLDALAAQDAALAAELRALLTQEQALSDEGFLERPVAEALQLDEGVVTAGMAIGPYQLERELGQGGMGSVWTAQRADGRFEGRVAVKFLRAGLFAAGDAGRFAREGQILARLSHPHIARLLDAGVQQGQPYLVLEYVDGQPIDAYCREQGLDIEARVRLFLDVLAAVGHAHAHLILHRDLKPSNILVTRNGEVKLLDFGIAKLLDDAGQGAAHTELTQLAGHAYTPQYAAPEQVQQSEVTTATDVYALGVLFYQLLGGGHPTAADTQMRLDLLKAVVEQVPRRLSEAARQGDDPQLTRQARQLRGDLDTIVAKALKKQPAERYVNAQALADDLQRWLAHEPIGARPDSGLYVLGRFVRRNRWAVAAGSLSVVVLLGLTAVSVIQARRAEAAEQQAQARRLQAEDLLSFMLGEFADKLRPIGRLELLDSIGSRALNHLAADAPAQAGERLNRAKALTVVGEVRVTRRELAAALEPLNAARQLLAGEPPDAGLTAAWRKAQGAAAFWIGQVHSLQREFGAAQKAWEDYRGFSQAWLVQAPEDQEAMMELSYAHTNLGVLALEGGRLADAARAFEESIGLKRRALPAMPGDKRDQALSDLAGSLSWLGQARLWRGELEPALATFREALDVLAPQRRARPADAPAANREAILNRWLAETLSALGRPAEATEALRVAQARFAELIARDATNRVWPSEALITRLLALEVAPPPVAQLQSLLPALGHQLDQLEQAGGAAAKVRRLPDRARWALLTLTAASPATRATALAQVEEVRGRLREALASRPGQLRLARALAKIDDALLRGATGASRPDRRSCELVRADLDLLRDLVSADPLVTAVWQGAAACEPDGVRRDVANFRERPASSP
ncbi:protein kinase domain-containing protein [Roseateles sp.]|uniref:protein kinase domain-containing protein n=1 Tax=Roseateles sp. TaxID=1971397 RepID=UPI0039EA3FC9